MTPQTLTAVAGGLIALSALLSWLLSLSFCTRAAPRWLRAWRDVALALGGARLVYVGVESSASQWWSAAIWLNLGAWGLAIAGWNAWDALRAGGSRCRADGERG